MSTPPPLSLVVVAHRSPLDARRGVVRVHPSVLDALELRPWDPVSLEGARVTGALVAATPERGQRHVILMDELACANAGVEVGHVVRVRRAEVRPAAALSIGGAPTSGAPPDPELLRFALLGKVVVMGDRVGLLPQDFAVPEDTFLEVGRQLGALASTWGSGWQEVDLTVWLASPPGLGASPWRPSCRGRAKQPPPAAQLRCRRSRADFPRAFRGSRTRSRPCGSASRSAFTEPTLRRLGGRPHMAVLVTGPPCSGDRRS